MTTPLWVVLCARVGAEIMLVPRLLIGWGRGLR